MSVPDDLRLRIISRSAAFFIASVEESLLAFSSVIGLRDRDLFPYLVRSRSSFEVILFPLDRLLLRLVSSSALDD